MRISILGEAALVLIIVGVLILIPLVILRIRRG
jgi:hypothetical protein